jgi:SAM-dependent methyltransferase
MDEDDLIKRQIEYYEARSREYDEWFFRIGRYYKGEENKRQWYTEAEAVREVLGSSHPSGRILELACGTGIWTDYLAPLADELVAVDVSPTSMELNRRRVKSDKVRYIQADLFSWRPTERFDYVFFGFWQSHIPSNRLESFWGLVAEALAIGGRVFFVDSLPDQDATARDHASIDRGGRARRKLNDGSEYEIIKVYYRPEELERRLHNWGWRGFVRATEHFFLYGCVERM